MKQVLYCFLILSLLSACQKDKFEVETVIREQAPKILIESILRGQVLAEDGSTIANAQVYLQNEQVRSDEFGNFRFRKTDVPKSGGIVRVEAPGYFPGSSTVNFTPEGLSFTKVTLLEKENNQSFTGQNGGTLRSNGGATLTFPRNSISLPGGSNYAGNVELTSRWLDPTDENLGAIMPGALTGVDENGNESALITYGMIAIDLETPSGQALEIKEGKEVEVKLPIPAELLADAPNTIPLWSFDLDQERWYRAGVCEKVGGNYTFKVDKTGYWNCDIPVDAICVTRQIFNADSTYASYLKVVIEDLTNNFIYWGYTDSTGRVCGSVPKDVPLRFYVYDHCDNIIYTEDIGPFDMDIDLNNLYLPETVEEYFVVITGKFENCNGDPFTGHASLSYPGSTRLFSLDFDGSFVMAVGLKCLVFPEMMIHGFDRDAQKVSLPVIHASNQDVDLGTITVCEDSDDYVNLQVDTESFWLAPTYYDTMPNTSSLRLEFEGQTKGGYMRFEIGGYTGVGQYTDDILFRIVNDAGDPDYPFLATTNGITINITGDNGNYIEGDLSGIVRDGGTGLDRNVSATFKIKKAL